MLCPVSCIVSYNIDWLIELLIDWLIDRVIAVNQWSIDWLIHWLIGQPTDWLIDQLIEVIAMTLVNPKITWKQREVVEILHILWSPSTVECVLCGVVFISEPKFDHHQVWLCCKPWTWWLVIFFTSSGSKRIFRLD